MSLRRFVVLLLSIVFGSQYLGDYSKMKTDVVTICISVAVVIAVVLLVFYLGRQSTSGDKPAAKQDDYHPYTERRDDATGSPKIRRRPPPNSQSRSSRQHPVLAYQRAASYDTHPASYGDPIRPPPGGIASGPSYGSGFEQAYGPGYEGPAVGLPLNVPVPQGSLKLSSEKYGYPFYYQQKPLAPYDYFKPYGPNQPGMQDEIVVSDTPFYKRGPFGFGGPTATSGTVPFISSVNSFAPFPEVQTAWEKTGMMQTEDPKDTTIMNLYRRPIAPLQDLFEYSAQDKNGFIIPLKGVNYLEDGDTVATVPGKEILGPWKVNVYVNNKWVWA